MVSIKNSLKAITLLVIMVCCTLVDEIGDHLFAAPSGITGKQKGSKIKKDGFIVSISNPKGDPLQNSAVENIRETPTPRCCIRYFFSRMPQKVNQGKFQPPKIVGTIRNKII